MRVLQVVTLVSPDGSYGGPTRVALNQSAELARRGIEVRVSAGTRGFDTVPQSMSNVPLALFPARQLLPRVGFAGLAAPAQIWWFLRSRRQFDVVHIHLARDLITPIVAALALLTGKRVYVQTHGMIDASNKRLSVPFDLLLIRPILRHARAVFCLTPAEAEDLEEVEPKCRIVLLPNGVPDPPSLSPTKRSFPGRSLEILYLARLESRKRPLCFVESAIEVLGRGGDAHFALVGPDEGVAEQVVDAIEGSAFASRLSWEGPLDPAKTLARMADSDLYVLPSVNEPFPMTVLEAMSIGVPVVITDTCGLAEAVRNAHAGTVVDDSTQALTAAIEAYLRDPALRARHGDNGRRLVHGEYSMEMVGDRLLAEYLRDDRPVVDGVVASRSAG